MEVDVLEEIAKLKGRVSEVEETMNVVYGLSFEKVPDEVLRLPCADRLRWTGLLKDTDSSVADAPQFDVGGLHVELWDNTFTVSSLNMSVPAGKRSADLLV